ncbi:methionyl-tRNA formyltransferase [candidate division WWE3 bacterium]|jgi:methionyl-tRNA formyltransferase|nr:methionyl-tRNA formyltransferase [candidate division WWE3 bacterium]MBT7350755.1 methionyl-tRNA formyltransferase [candidate division WWE3 bacterium]
MNIAFFGTSDRSIPLLEALKTSDFDLKLCITKNDVKVGRKQELKPTAVKTWAEENGVQCLTVDSLRGDTTGQTSSTLSEGNIELGVVADFSFIIPEEIFDLPKHKIVNIHFSLLPKYRGASPVQHAILNLDEKIGISYQLIVKGMDEGPIIHQTEYKLEGTETTNDLYPTLFNVSAKELPEILKKYVDGEAKPKEQPSEGVSYTYSPSHPKSTHIYKEDAKIDWEASPSLIDAMIRAFNPWPIAWTTLGEFGNLKEGKNPKLKVKIYSSEVVNDELVIKTIQVEGKNKVSWNEFKNGYLIR